MKHFHWRVPKQKGDECFNYWVQRQNPVGYMESFADKTDSPLH